MVADRAGADPRFSKKSLTEWGLGACPSAFWGVRRESGRGFHKVSDFVKALGANVLKVRRKAVLDGK